MGLHALGQEQRDQLAALTAKLAIELDRNAALSAQILDLHAQLAERDELIRQILSSGLGNRERAIVELVLRSRRWRHRLKARLGLDRPG